MGCPYSALSVGFRSFAQKNHRRVCRARHSLHTQTRQTLALGNHRRYKLDKHTVTTLIQTSSVALVRPDSRSDHSKPSCLRRHNVPFSKLRV